MFNESNSVFPLLSCCPAAFYLWVRWTPPHFLWPPQALFLCLLHHLSCLPPIKRPVLLIVPTEYWTNTVCIQREYGEGIQMNKIHHFIVILVASALSKRFVLLGFIFLKFQIYKKVEINCDKHLLTILPDSSIINSSASVASLSAHRYHTHIHTF